MKPHDAIICVFLFFFLLLIVYTYPKFIRKSRNARAFNALFLNFFHQITYVSRRFLFVRPLYNPHEFLFNDLGKTLALFELIIPYIKCASHTNLIVLAYSDSHHGPFRNEIFYWVKKTHLNEKTSRFERQPIGRLLSYVAHCCRNDLYFIRQE